jgi:hypothetical protein
MASQKSDPIQTVLNRYKLVSARSLSEAIKTHPLKTLLGDQEVLKNALLTANQETMPFLRKTLRMVKNATEERLKIADMLIENLLQQSPEILTLHYTLDKLFQYWNLLDDTKVYYKIDVESLKRLILAKKNLFEVLNIKLQLDFFNTTPKVIAFKYSEEQLLNYKVLLEHLFPTPDEASDFYKVYQSTLTNIEEGLLLFRKWIKPIKEVQLVLETASEEMLINNFQQYPTEKLENYKTLLKATLEYLDKINIKSSNIMAFKEECQTLLIKILTPLKIRKAYLVQTIRVLRLCDHIMLVDPKDLAKNLAKVLINCRELLKQTQEFFRKYPHQLDSTLDLGIIERAEEKIVQVFKTRGRAIQALCMNLDKQPINQVVKFPPSILKNCSELLKETESLLSEYIGMRMPVEPSIEKALELVQRNTEKLKKTLALQKAQASVQGTPKRSYVAVSSVYEIVNDLSKRAYQGRFAHLVMDSIAVVEQVAKDLRVELSTIKPIETKIEELEAYITFLSKESAEEQKNQQSEKEILRMAQPEE